MEGQFMLLFLVLFPMAGALLTGLAGLGGQADKDGLSGGGKGKGVKGGGTAQAFRLPDYLTVLITGAEFLTVLLAFNLTAQSPDAVSFSWDGFCGPGIRFTLEGFRYTQIFLTAFAFLMAAAFSLDYMRKERNRCRYDVFMLLTLGAVMGVFLSEDLFTTFLFFEVMSFTSCVWVAQEETKEALKAAGTYLVIAVLGGLVMLMGLFVLYHTAGTLDMTDILAACREVGDKTPLYIAGFCLLFGFGAKAGIFGLHIWMPSSYEQAPAPASALLSGILSKTGLFGIMVVSADIFASDMIWGVTVLVFGVLTMAGGAVLALFEVNLKRTLAYSSMSQIGFMLVGIGIYCLSGDESSLAVRGTILHMINHSVIKMVLFIAAGVVFMNVGKLNLNDIRGFGRKKPVLNLAFLMGALGIGGIPLWNGYVSKTLLHESIVEFMQLSSGNTVFMYFAEWLFLISGGFTVAYMAKLYIAIFIEKNTDPKVQENYEAMKGSYMKPLSAAVLLAGSCMIVLLGAVPHMVSDRIADMSQDIMYAEDLKEAVQYFSLTSLKGGVTSILIGVLLYILIVRTCLMKKDEQGNTVYGNYWPTWLSLQRVIYRPLMFKVLPTAGLFFARIGDTLVDGIVVALRRTLYQDKRLEGELEEGTAVTHAAGRMMDAIYWLFHKKSNTHNTPATSYVHKLAVLHEELTENNRIIGRSLSFGLLLFCVGFILTVVYLFWL